jgi:RimJ/RimL family protein N-acetyltransferase
MIELQRLVESDFDIFRSWITNANDLIQFAGQIFQYPLTDAQLSSYILDHRRIVYKVVLQKNNSMIGNAELNFENSIPRLSRILIGDVQLRNKGIGKRIVEEMLCKLFKEMNYTEADLNVFEWNRSAIECYQRVGFNIHPEITSFHSVNGEIWKAINMKITKDEWLKSKA